MTEVPFIGHIATADGLCVDAGAINEIPAPIEVAAVQRLLGLTQYLSKFLDVTKPLRELTQKDAGISYNSNTLKKTVSTTL